jgi:hypothetical protein
VLLQAETEHDISDAIISGVCILNHIINYDNYQLCQHTTMQGHGAHAAFAYMPSNGLCGTHADSDLQIQVSQP